MQTEYQGITRTVCVGIGGTGEDVLIRIRKLIVDRYGSLDSLPVVSFVHIDTDNANAAKGRIDHRGTDINFRENEVVKAVISTSEAKVISEGLEEIYRSKSRHINPHSHIANWFPPELAKNISAIEKGAQARRPIGRLAFSQNYQKFQRAIDEAEKRTAGNETSLLQQQKLRLDKGTNFFVVASLCGGTGSGMFLDVAYAIRKICEDTDGIKLSGYLVTSPQVYGDTAQMYANVYAALKELDYYSREHTRFNICYKLDENKALLQEPRPPFDFTYLVSRDTLNSNFLVKTKGKLCNIIAQKIALDFSSELAPKVKSMRDNFADSMLKLDDHPRPNCQNYMAFGLASIYFPKERIINITESEVGCKLTEFWLNGKGQRPEPQSLIDQFLQENSWHPNPDKKDGFTSSLEKIAIEGDKSFKKLIDPAKSILNKSVDEVKNESDRQGLPNRLKNELNSRFRKTIHNSIDSERGDWITKLQKANPAIEKQYKQQIDSFITELLRPSNTQFSIKNARNWLDAMQTELENYRQSIEQEVNKLGGAKTLEHLEKDISKTFGLIEEINNEFELPIFGKKNSKVKAEASGLIKRTFEAINHNFRLSVHQEAIKICKSLLLHTESYISELTNLNDSCQNLSNAFYNAKKDGKNLNIDEINGEAVFTDDDIDRCYKILLPEKEKEDFIELTKNVLETFSNDISLTGLKNLSEIDLKEGVPKVLSKFLSNRLAKFNGSVIQLFAEKHPVIIARRDRLKQLLDSANILLPLNFIADFYKNGSEKTSRIIGFKDDEEREVKDFKSLLEDNEVKTNEQEKISREDEVVITVEYAGFPIRIIRGIEDFKFKYDQQKQTNSLHNDHSIDFPDVFPPAARVVQELQDLFYPCLALEIITRDLNTQKLNFKYYDFRQEKDESKDLSSEWNFAIEEIYLSKGIQFSLRQNLDQLIESTNQVEWEKKYAPMLKAFIREVSSYTNQNPNYRCQDAILGSEEIGGTLGIIKKFQQDVKDILLNRTSQSQLSSGDNLIASQTQSSQVLDVDVVLDSIETNRDKRRVELASLKQDLTDEFITQEEYEVEKQRIFREYPIT